MGLSKKIAYRLRTLREAAGLSQQEVAERADLSLSLIAKMEQGRKADPRASSILALAVALGVRPGQLIEDLQPPPADFIPGKAKKAKKKKKRIADLVGGANWGRVDQRRRRACRSRPGAEEAEEEVTPARAGDLP